MTFPKILDLNCFIGDLHHQTSTTEVCIIIVTIMDIVWCAIFRVLQWTMRLMMMWLMRGEQLLESPLPGVMMIS